MYILSYVTSTLDLPGRETGIEMCIRKLLSGLYTQYYVIFPAYKWHSFSFFKEQKWQSVAEFIQPD